MADKLKATAKRAALVFRTKADAGPLTDAEIRAVIKALREVIAERQRRRGAERYLARQTGS